MGKGFLLVEGHGEVEAAGNLISRLWQELDGAFTWSPARRWKNLHRKEGVVVAAERARATPEAAALLILRDADEDCPKDLGPKASRWLAELALPFPAAFVLFKPEYEVLFLPCLHLMAGRPLPGRGGERPGLRPGTVWHGDWERRRGLKESLSEQFPENQIYKPTTDQLVLTRWIDIPTLRAANVACFGTLERALAFLAANPGHGAVYPDPTNEE